VKRLSLSYWRAYVWARRYGVTKDTAALYALYARRVGLLRPSLASYEQWLARERVYARQHLRLLK
jgi:hypothetical protein